MRLETCITFHSVRSTKAIPHYDSGSPRYSDVNFLRHHVRPRQAFVCFSGPCTFQLELSGCFGPHRRARQVVCRNPQARWAQTQLTYSIANQQESSSGPLRIQNNGRTISVAPQTRLPPSQVSSPFPSCLESLFIILITGNMIHYFGRNYAIQFLPPYFTGSYQRCNRFIHLVCGHSICHPLPSSVEQSAGGEYNP